MQALNLDLVAPHLTRRRLRLILLPTEACNLRCVYCYETFRYKRMEPWVVDGVKRLMDRRAPELDSLELSWFGGEPLLARDIMVDVLRHARSLSAGLPDLRLFSEITTNAYLLTRETFRELCALGVTDYQISFDGPREFHDRKRVLAGGKGTFDRVWGNTLALREEPGAFRVLVRVHADRDNEEAIPEFIRMYGEAFGSDTRFELFVRPLSRLGGPNDHRLAIFSEDEAARSKESWRRMAAERGLRHKKLEVGPSICYAAAVNTFVVRANGRLNKCTVALEHPNNQVGKLLPDGKLALDMPRMTPWTRGIRSGNAAEMACPMMGLAEPGPQSRVSEDIPLTLASSSGRV